MGLTRMLTVAVYVSDDGEDGYRAVARLRGAPDRDRGVGAWHPHGDGEHAGQAGEAAATARALSDLASRIATAADNELACRAQHPAGKGRSGSSASHWRSP